MNKIIKIECIEFSKNGVSIKTELIEKEINKLITKQKTK